MENKIFVITDHSKKYDILVLLKRFSNYTNTRKHSLSETQVNCTHYFTTKINMFDVLTRTIAQVVDNFKVFIIQMNTLT